jgi:uncharacterized protein
VFKKGFYQHKSTAEQLLILLALGFISFFVIGMIGTVLLSALIGIPIDQLSSLGTLKTSPAQLGFFIRGMQFVQFLGLFLVPSLLAARMFSVAPAREYLYLSKPSHFGFWIIGVSALIFSIPLVQWLGELNQSVQFPPDIADWLKAKENEANDTIKALFELHSSKDLLLNIIFVAGLAGIGEELLFRGVLQRLFQRQFGQVWPAILLSAFLFSAMHLQFYGFLPRFVLGIVLGALYWYSGSLLTAMLAHFVYDAFLIVLVYQKPALLQEEPVVDMQTLMVTGLVSALIVTFHIHWMLRHTRTDEYQGPSSETSDPNS